MRLAFTTLACPRWTLEQVVAGARRCGYDGIELRLLDGALITPALGRDDRMRVRATLADAGLPIVCLDTSVRVAQPDRLAAAAQIDDAYGMLELAAEWGAPVIRVFAAPPDETPLPQAIEAAIATMRPIAERGATMGIQVALETHDAFCASGPVGAVLDAVPQASALWDLLHPFRVGEPTAVTLERLRGRISHVHIKDGRPPADGGDRWDLTLLGEGLVPTRDILAALHAGGYDGWIAVEWEKQWHPHLAEPEVALPQFAERLRADLAAIGVAS